MKNDSGVDKYFYVRLEPDNGCSLSGDEVVQVLIQKQDDVSQTGVLMSDSSLMVVPDGIMLGVAKQTINYKDLVYVGGSGCNQFIHHSGWNELNIKGDDAYGTLKTPKDYYMGNLEFNICNF